jgi:hypothetical protein
MDLGIEGANKTHDYQAKYQAHNLNLLLPHYSQAFGTIIAGIGLRCWDRWPYSLTAHLY